jgi:hypothetical protein
MKLHVETVKESGHILIRLGEASIIGGAATWFVQSFPRLASLSGLAVGLILVFSGLYFVNKSHLEE